MYQYLNKIPSIKELSVVFGKISYAQNNVFIIGNYYFNVNPMFYSEDVNNNIWIKDINWRNFVINFSDKEIKLLDFNIGINGKIGNVIIIAKDGISSCLSTISQEIICDINIDGVIRYYLTYNNSLFCHINDSKLISISPLSGIYNWQTDLSHYRYKRTGERHEARIQQVIGVWEGQLLVWMDGNKFLSLSVETGELLWEINRWEYVEGKGHGYYFGHGVHLDETKGKCYLFEGTCYIEIDLATQNVTTLWQEDIITYGRLFGRPNFTPDYIYFLIGGVCSISVGVFDRKTLQMVWQHDFVFDQSGAEYIMLNQPPQVADNKLYVLDTGGTLHIFERIEA